jgi:hypothetical protein
LTALHDHGNFGRAADACHVTQSTLSASIKELELLLQVTLVDRSKRHVVLTPVGVETVERARWRRSGLPNTLSREISTESIDDPCARVHVIHIQRIPV